MIGYLKRRFDFDALGTSFSKEILAGLSVFFSLSYIFVVNPAILSDAGMDKSVVLFATVIASAAATFAMGWWARVPFVLAPGLEMNAFVAYVIVGTLGYTWQQALGMVFWSGVLFVVLTMTGARRAIIDSIPKPMKITLAFAVGIFVLVIGLRITDILIYDKAGFVGVSSLISDKAIALYLGLAVLLALKALKFPAYILLSIVASAVYLNVVGAVAAVEGAQLSKGMLDGMFALKPVFSLESGAAISAIFVLFVVDFYGSIAKFIGLSIKTPINMAPRLPSALQVDGWATIGGSMVGTSSITTYVESAVGIGAGGRTGLTAIVCAVFMLLTIFAAPLLQYVPVAATAPALLYVGYRLFPDKELRKLYSRVDWLVLIGVGIIVLAMFSLDKAMLFGFGSYVLIAAHSKWIKKTSAKLDVFLILSVVLLAMSVVFS